MNHNTSISSLSLWERAGVRVFRTVILFAFLFLASGRAQTPAAAPKVAAVPDKNAAYISTFTDSRTFGKDPFFPKSKRREVAAPVIAVNTPLPPGELPAGMVLKGLSGTKDKPLAIINNYTFAEGEESEIRIANQIYRIKVVEIKERSVMVQVNGTEARELAFRANL